MSRNTSVNDILFPVTLADVQYTWQPPQAPGKQVPAVQRRAPRHRAVVRTDTGEALSFVSDGYRLVTNAEALGLAEQCFKQVFDEQDCKAMTVFNVIAPASGSFCHVDFIHQNYEINIWAQEAWLPYLRVTNSYNRLRTLRFDIGFCRKLCDNGVVFEQQTTRLQFSHDRRQIAPVGQFMLDAERLEKLKTDFVAYMSHLHTLKIPERYVLPLICQALGLKFDVAHKDARVRQRQKERLAEFKAGIRELQEHYIKEFGLTAYAALNIASDVASRPFLFPAASVMVDTLQKRVGQWISAFHKASQAEAFDLEKHLADYLAFAQYEEVSAG